MKTTSLFLSFRSLLIPGIVSVAMSSLPAKITDTVTRSFSAGDNPHLVVEVAHTDVSVLPGSSDSIDFTITRTARTNDAEKARQSFDAYPLTFEEDGDTVTLSIRKAGKSSFFGSRPKEPDITVAVTVPAMSRVSIKTASGDVELKGVNGDHRLDTASGDIAIKTVQGDLYIDTASGDIVGSALEGLLRFSTASGDVILTDVGPEIDANSASGDIKIKGAGGTVKANAASGDITVKGSSVSVKASAASGDIHLEIAELIGSVKGTTASGDVLLRLGPDNHAVVTLISNSRRVGSSIPLTDVVQSEKQRQLKGVLGSGTHQINLRTASGDVELEEL
ncbi:MAG: hypothetical protein DRP71_05780 [Verrucomicrobia bacterium]|nr:MAG: hypothetical protein DRP71_05780 [Verrucomicrobiota bacterium]